MPQKFHSTKSLHSQFPFNSSKWLSKQKSTTTFTKPEKKLQLKKPKIKKKKTLIKKISFHYFPIHLKFTSFPFFCFYFHPFSSSFHISLFKDLRVGKTIMMTRTMARKSIKFGVEIKRKKKATWKDGWIDETTCLRA